MRKMDMDIEFLRVLISYYFAQGILICTPSLTTGVKNLMIEIEENSIGLSDLTWET